MAEKKALAIRSYDISKPKEVAKMANIVKSHVLKNRLYVPIAGRNYVLVEGWQFAGGLMGLFPRVKDVKNIGEGKWLAEVEIVNRRTGEVISSGFALCSKEEVKKKTFDEYAILSMAQTRAIGKAYRNLIGWIMKLAGYEATPAEEMISVGEKQESLFKNKDFTIPVGAKTGGKKVEELKKMLKGETEKEKLTDLEKRTGIRLNSFEITEKHASVLIASLLNKDVKRI
jgi:hypothetical protein